METWGSVEAATCGLGLGSSREYCHSSAIWHRVKLMLIPVYCAIYEFCIRFVEKTVSILLSIGTWQWHTGKFAIPWSNIDAKKLFKLPPSWKSGIKIWISCPLALVCFSSWLSLFLLLPASPRPGQPHVHLSPHPARPSQLCKICEVDVMLHKFLDAILDLNLLNHRHFKSI